GEMKRTTDKGITGKFLLDILHKKSLITNEELDRILKIQRENGSKDLQKIIIELNILKKDEMMIALADEIGEKYVNLDDTTIDPTIVVLIPEEMARRHQLIAIDKNEKKLTVAMANPLDVFAHDELKIRLGYDIETVLSYGEDIDKALDEVFGVTDEWDQVIGKVETMQVTVLKEEEKEKADISAISESEEAPIIALVNLIILRAVKEKASDIHIEPFGEDTLKVRYRIDGILHDVMSLPRNLQLAVISRIKIMSDLDIAERRLPQDGRIQVNVGGRNINIRVSILPAVTGETAVLRILDPSSILLDLDSLGFSPDILPDYLSLIKKPNGIILVTGPTGSGKSTTLYTTLNLLNSTEKKIMTIEDPVEYRLKGISQVQAKPKIGLTFAAGLRSFLRQDPDIMLVGEIRDKETAEIAVQSALTGHIVLSTLHTNDAPSSVIRLIDMGIEPFLISSSVIGVIAQRLVRRICPKCKKEMKITPDIEKILHEYEINRNEITLYKGEGCPYCKDTGYKGRVAIFELMVITENIKDLISKNVTTGKLREAAISEGMCQLREDGIKKVCEGQTTIDEVLRVASA
ncbi:MAG: type II secretion system ATPase GspE, partial [Candidatus Caldatribacteriota bacterium]|nr:type II secretion system ATPase GspE [Candidatus Caldatribacteriota bacterium]